MATAPTPKVLTNVGAPDRAIRVAVGLVVLMLGLLFESWWGLVGLVPLVTGTLGFCPVYRLLGRSTRRLG